MGNQKVDQLAKVIWDYHHLNHELEEADVMMVFTSIDKYVPKYAAELLQKGLSSLMIISGGGASEGSYQKTDWGMTEADLYAKIVYGEGVPEDKVIVENKSTNSGENVQFSEKIVKERGLKHKKVLVVHKPTMERRAFATFKNFWTLPDTELIVTSPQFSYEEYVGKIVDREQIINIMVGDLQRIKIYPEKGFQIPQNIPEDAWSAYGELVEMGFDKHLVSE